MRRYSGHTDPGGEFGFTVATDDETVAGIFERRASPSTFKPISGMKNAIKPLGSVYNISLLLYYQEVGTAKAK